MIVVRCLKISLSKTSGERFLYVFLCLQHCLGKLCVENRVPCTSLQEQQKTYITVAESIICCGTVGSVVRVNEQN